MTGEDVASIEIWRWRGVIGATMMAIAEVGNTKGRVRSFGGIMRVATEIGRLGRGRNDDPPFL